MQAPIAGNIGRNNSLGMSGDAEHTTHRSAAEALACSSD